MRVNKSPRMRVNERVLDHFLTFITSSYIIQDLPFGEKHLKLSCGTIIEMPNVIRSIIPSRIVEQYLCHCKEGNPNEQKHYGEDFGCM